MNFNGADGSSNLFYVRRNTAQPKEAVCRLLLGRGLIECESGMGWIAPSDGGVKDENLPLMEEVVEALFHDRFGVDEGGFLVVHLDEPSLLLDDRAEAEALNRATAAGSANGVEGTTVANSEDRFDAHRWVKSFIGAFSSFTDPADNRL